VPTDKNQQQQSVAMSMLPAGFSFTPTKYKPSLYL